jgi:uncharacterized protein (DUF736 family)
MNLTEAELALAADNIQKLSQLHKDKKFFRQQLDVFNAIFRDGYKRIFIRKGRKAGGTETVIYPLVRTAGLIPYSSCFLIGPTLVQQAEIVWQNRRLQQFIPKEWNPTFLEQEKRVRFPNESFIKVDGAEDPNRARGYEPDIIAWDERKDHNNLSLESCYPNLLAKDGIWIEFGSPPTKKTNGYYIREMQAKEDPDWKVFIWTAWDNPFVSDEWLTKEKKKYYDMGMGHVWESEYEAEYVFDGARKVIPNFREKHKAPRSILMEKLERDKKSLKWVACIDPGYATCFAVLFVAYNPYTSEIFFLDEIYSTEKESNSAKEMWPKIEEKQKALWQGEWTNLYDSAALSFAVEVRALVKEEGRQVKLVPTKKEKGDEDAYFRVLNGIFSDVGQGWVSKENKYFILEMEDYETDENGKYPNFQNHLLDDARYILKHLRYTHRLQQATTQIIPVHQKPSTLRDFFEEDRRKNDMVGFGGADAKFNLKDAGWK